MPYQLDGKKVVVVGLARSGLAAVRFLVKQGAAVKATDQKSKDEIAQIEMIASLPGVKLYMGGHPLDILTDADLLVISPGVNEEIPFIKEAEQNKIPIISEFELATSQCEKPLIAVTGTNGKTTTTTVIGKILSEHGLKVVVAGNIGQAATLETENINQAEVGILEVSSFQLERSETFKPKGALILNVTPDHQDRYASIYEYRQAKAKIFQNQDQDDWTIFNFDDPLCLALKIHCRAEQYFFSRKSVVDQGTYIKDGIIIFKDNQGAEKKILAIKEIALMGLPNLENYLAAILTACLWGVEVAAIRHVARSFTGLPHRMESVATINGVRYINDSKGTNVDAVAKSLESFNDPVILIMGGRDKGGDFCALIPLAMEKVKTLILLGEAQAKLAEVFNGICPVKLVTSLDEAVQIAAGVAAAGDVVLLSPGCTSWDMFEDYQQRGDVFKNAVRGLRSESDG